MVAVAHHVLGRRAAAGELRARVYPWLLLDEPTASLGAANREVVLTLIEEAKARGAAVVGMHDEAARARMADREAAPARRDPRQPRRHACALA